MRRFNSYAKYKYNHISDCTIHTNTIINNFITFLNEHYPMYKLDTEYLIILKKDFKIIKQTPSISEMEDFLTKELFFHRIFIKYSKIDCILHYLRNTENLYINKLTNNQYEVLFISTNGKIKNIVDESELYQIAEDFEYSLEEVKKDICPYCKDGLYEKTRIGVNWIREKCSYCGHENTRRI